MGEHFFRPATLEVLEGPLSEVGSPVITCTEGMALFVPPGWCPIVSSTRPQDTVADFKSNAMVVHAFPDRITELVKDPSDRLLMKQHLEAAIRSNAGSKTWSGLQDGLKKYLPKLEGLDGGV